MRRNGRRRGLEHGFSRARASKDVKALRAVLLITAILLVVEAVGGLLSGSLALLADAGHMLTDVASLLLSLIAFKLASRPRSSSRTFGWRRAEIFAAFLNGIALWGIAGLIGYEAVMRTAIRSRSRAGS